MSNSIYKFTNKINGHLYIGMSKDPKRRYSEHKKSAYNEKDKDYNLPFHRAIRKYGIENFDFEIIEENIPTLEEMKAREIYWIQYYNAYKDKKHYNATPGGDRVGENSCLKGEAHGRHILTEEEVKYCRQAYKEGNRSRDIYNEKFKEKITYEGFLKMWHGKTWTTVMPEVFTQNPHRAKYGAEDRDIITTLFKESGLSLRQFQKTEECYVGYGTLWKMINQPDFYEEK